MNIDKLEIGKLYSTTEYDIFELHDCNRNLRACPKLEASMRKHGFMPSCAIHVRKNGHGKLKVIRGHHRLDEGKRQNLAIYYIIDDTAVDIFEMEGSSHPLWSSNDWVSAYTNDGREDYVMLQEFAKDHGYSIGLASSLIGGESAGSNNKIDAVKRGTLKIGDMSHANEVAEITDTCRSLKIPFATNTYFVQAVSAMARLCAFDKDYFVKKLRTFPREMARRSTRNDFMDEIEGLYNKGLRDQKNLAFLAQELMKQRQKTFGHDRKAKA